MSLITVSKISPMLTEKDRLETAVRLMRIPYKTPLQLDQELLSRGYCGQPVARRAGAVLAYRHLRRLRRAYVDETPSRALPPRAHALLLGATGCGKSFLLELLFQEILGLPCTFEDGTLFTESGYVGQDLDTMFTRLFDKAGHHLGWASTGVICLDEFDKMVAPLAKMTGRTNNRNGVQSSLLTLMSGPAVHFPIDPEDARSPRVDLPLDHVLFMCCGAFGGLLEQHASRNPRRMGFMEAVPQRHEVGMFGRLSDELLGDTRLFAEYGLQPEVLGRFQRVIPFQPLSEDELDQILEKGAIRQYEQEFEYEGIKLLISKQARRGIVNQALEKQLGARGLSSALARVLEDASFMTFGQQRIEAVNVEWSGDALVLEYKEQGVWWKKPAQLDGDECCRLDGDELVYGSPPNEDTTTPLQAVNA